MVRKFGEPRVFQADIVVGIQIVNANHLAPVGKQTGGNMKADKAGCSGDQDWAI
jgi:hypothetical protein